MLRILVAAALLARPLSTLATQIYDVPLLFSRQTTALQPCRLNYTTDIWTGCDDVLAQFHITLDQFIAANPGIGKACDGFVPGKTYCIYRENQPKNISADGTCGRQIQFRASCIGSKFGDCCNAAGKCGSGDAYCGKGNCQEGKCDGGIAYSTDGKCGRDYNYLPCPPKFGLCCSGTGACGNLTQFCTTGCQSGPCLATSTTSSSLPPTSSPTNKPGPGSVSSDGTCGYNDQWTCKGSKFGSCCSAAGYCGNTQYECSPFLGCQSKYGTCTST